MGVLTQRQHQLLKFIQDYLDEYGVPPSFDEMRNALKLKSKSGIHRLITGLEERGYIRRLAYRARALEVVRLPESLQKVAGGDLVGNEGCWRCCNQRRSRPLWDQAERGTGQWRQPAGLCCPCLAE